MTSDQEIRSKIQECAIEETVEITDRRSIAKEFQHLYTKKARECRVEHLTKGSRIKIKTKCFKCGKVRYVFFYNCFRDRNFTGLCSFCCAQNKGKSKAIDITGQRFNKLVALEPTEKRKSSHIVWKCQCDCMNITYVANDNLKSGAIKSCGCLNKEKVEEYHRSKGRRISSDYTQEENEAYQEETKTFYNSKEWRIKRKEIIERDKHCKLCGATNNLHVHHIYDRKLYPEYEFDNTKLITLCSSCHSSYHSQAKNITETSFTVFIITK